ncbi:hypothetical protein K3217_22985 [bacterium BD-1]|nr:hypothetical protein [Ottowia caeni]
MTEPNKILPRLIYWILCDDIREEKGNKHTLIGVASGGDLILPKGTYKQGAAIASLCIFAKFEGGVGQFTQKLSLRSPSGNKFEVAGDSVELIAGKSHVSQIKIAPFLLEGLGQYHITQYFDDREFEMTFNISEAE